MKEETILGKQKSSKTLSFHKKCKKPRIMGRFFFHYSAIEAVAPILMSFKLSFDWDAEDSSLLANNFDIKLD
uniref:Uncharacterized protein n=1 Tax=Romanomermis culicivorax TaxID=13658 RepID=A0A915HN93_ROMCU